VKADEPMVELETDKVTVEVPAPTSGKLSSISAASGSTVKVGALLGAIEEGAAGAAAKPTAAAPVAAKVAEPVKVEAPLSPAVRKIVTENKVDSASLAGTGKDGRVTKGDVIEQLSKPIAMPAAAPAPLGGEERVKMSRLRLTIARRLKEAQNTAAMLTTFNEVDMSAVMTLRNSFKDVFEKKHGVKLGFMSFFAKAVIQALKDVPAVNAEIDGEDLVYKNYYHLGVAVGTEKGLVVPVVRDADRMSFATIEKTIADYGKKARDGQLQIADMQGGTFTISNGGVYGSLMSTPILNAPQSGILGMHKIQDRPVAVNGQVVIRPMMYLALSYDHRIVDGKEAVTFLVRVKESLEDPQRSILDL
jgi:2-oxoglutarate dehydrogenase E2 component (dihydrolipoamide succinyltransferase)